MALMNMSLTGVLYEFPIYHRGVRADGGVLAMWGTNDNHSR